MWKHLLPLSLVAVVSSPSFAESAGTERTAKLTGEGSVGAALSTGNTDTMNLNGRVRLKWSGDNWQLSSDVKAEYGESNGIESKNRLDTSSQIDRRLNEAWSGFFRASWQRNEFSGYKERYFVTLGASWKIFDDDGLHWQLQGGPGWGKRTVRAPPYPGDAFGVNLGSRLKYKMSDRVEVSNETDVIHYDAQAEITNEVALTVGLMENLSTRISYELRHDTEPRAGFKETDSTSRVSLVYKIR